MDIIQKVSQWVNKHNLIASNQTIIVGLSGGPDSVFLLHYLKHLEQPLNLRIIAAHLDHEWRQSSAQDAVFCSELAHQLNVPLISKRMSELDYQQTCSGSKEQDARNARRYFFELVAKEYHADSIALAQHKNDQEETFFIRLLRGSSLTGLTCMWPKRGTYIRPLLACTKNEILDWLEKQRHSYVIDPTNLSLDYLRNRIRHELLPIIKRIDNRFDHNFFKTLHNLQATELFLQKLTNEAFEAIATPTTDKRYTITISALLKQERIMQYRLLMHWFIIEQVSFPASQTFLDEILRFLEQPGNKTHALLKEWTIEKKDFKATILLQSPENTSIPATIDKKV